MAPVRKHVGLPLYHDTKSLYWCGECDEEEYLTTGTRYPWVNSDMPTEPPREEILKFPEIPKMECDKDVSLEPLSPYPTPEQINENKRQIDKDFKRIFEANILGGTGRDVIEYYEGQGLNFREILSHIFERENSPMFTQGMDRVVLTLLWVIMTTARDNEPAFLEKDKVWNMCEKYRWCLRYLQSKTATREAERETGGISNFLFLPSLAEQPTVGVENVFFAPYFDYCFEALLKVEVNDKCRLKCLADHFLDIERNLESLSGELNAFLASKGVPTEMHTSTTHHSFMAFRGGTARMRPQRGGRTSRAALRSVKKARSRSRTGVWRKRPATGLAWYDRASSSKRKPSPRRKGTRASPGRAKRSRRKWSRR